jgi:ABC-type sugar transport system ATPase subunit
MAELRLEALRKTFGGAAVLHGLDLHVPEGAFCVIVGPSGCGKSTLLRLVSGLEEADTGRIVIGGQDVTHLPAAERNVAMVFQNYALLPHLSVARNIAFGMEIRGEPRAEIARRVAETAAILRLEEHLDKKPRALSGGQRQRVAMGRAILRQPAAFLFDEPLSNLDAQLRGEMRVEIKRLHQRLGATALYVTHDQTEAMTMSDLLVVMNKGRIEQIGTPIDVYRRPATRFVAGFIGAPAMNFLPMSCEEGRRCDSLFGPLPAPPGAVQFGVRPEHLEALATGPGIGADVIVTLVEPHGADTFVHCEAEDGTPLLARLDAGAVPQPGQRLTLRPRPGMVHFFDAEGRRTGDLPELSVRRQRPQPAADHAALPV